MDKRLGNVDVPKLIEWLGSEGAKAGLQHSKLSLDELVEIARDHGVYLSPKPTREEIANELAYEGRNKIDRNLESLLRMSQKELFDYLHRIKPTAREILNLLGELGIKPSSVDRRQLLRFAAREISDTGMYQRVAEGQGRDKHSGS